SIAAKRREVELRQQLACGVLGNAGQLGDERNESEVGHAGQAVQSHASHLWLELPPPWRADPFVEQAARRGVAVPAAAPFAADPPAARAAVGICLGAEPDRDRLKAALKVLAELLAEPPPPEAAVV